MRGKPWLGMMAVALLLMSVSVARAFTVVEVREVAFSFYPEAEPHARLEMAEVRSNNSGYIYKRQELEAYRRVLETQPGELRDFDTWNAQGGPAPRIFRIRVQVKNYGNEPSGETPVNVLLMAKVGEFLVDQEAFMVDQAHLHNTAKWATVQTLSGVIPPLAQGETFDYYSEPVMFGAYLLGLKHQFPVALQATATLPQSSSTKTLEIPVKIDHFALEDLQR